MRIYLIGYMGSGKTKTAVSLAKILKYSHVDIDQLIIEKTGVSISAIFEQEGEGSFRKHEKNILHSTKEIDNVVISTGGGTSCYSDNMEWMNDYGITVYLDANPGLLFHRLASSREGRPLIENLNDVELMEQITGHLAIRIPFYKKANITVPAINMNVNELASKIRLYKK